MAKVLVLLAEGAEEIETTVIVDVLRRANIDVTLAGIAGTEAVTCSRGVRIIPDLALADAAGDYDAIVLPGGAGGAERLCDSEDVGRLLRDQWTGGKIVAAICAAPIALLRHNIAGGRRLTSHPSVRGSLGERYDISDDRVVEDGQLVTSQGPGTAFEFALTLVRRLQGNIIEEKVAAPMML